MTARRHLAYTLAMESVDYLIVGAGVTGLAFANAILEHMPEARLAIIEADSEIGGYCKTVRRSGFVWDYSGHFFHFRHPEIENWLRTRMPDANVRTVQKSSTIYHDGQTIDFPFQKNIHQLNKEAFIECLTSLYFRAEQPVDATPGSFQHMVIERFGRGIADRFLIPYNEKLYATSLDDLDATAMGRFFPHADVDEIIRNMQPKTADENVSYNSTFTYPSGGAIEYIGALCLDLPAELISRNEALTGVDLTTQVAKTNTRAFQFSHLISSAPLPRLAQMCGLQTPAGVLTSNKVLVFNLGFDRKGPRGVHWTYFPDRDFRFYRVGFYDNIMDDERMSLYVEIGMATDAEVDVELERARVLADLAVAKIVTDHQLVDWHSVVLDPAYVHVTGSAVELAADLRSALAAKNVHSAGRYGGWTYCSIEDNIVEARALAAKLAGASTSRS